MRAEESIGHARLHRFRQLGIGLDRNLRDMLAELLVHCTERRGCGYTQATRHLATRINAPRDPLAADDLLLLGAWSLPRVEALAARAVQAGWPLGWRELHRAPPDVLDVLPDSDPVDALIAIGHALDTLVLELAQPGMRLFCDLLRQTVGGGRSGAPALPVMPGRPEIGSCSQAEEFFLEIAHGKIRRGGRVNVYVDENGSPLLVEKIDLGESHSAMSVAALRINDVVLPPGSLFALRFDARHQALTTTQRGGLFPFGAIAQARFLRLSTLSMTPAERPLVFPSQFKTQVQRDFLSPATTTIDDLMGYARARLTAET